MANTINVAIYGSVSAGKSTITNALFIEQFSDMRIKRTTALPQVYMECVNPQNYDAKKILETNREKNIAIMARTEDSSKPLRYEEIEEIKYDVPKMFDFVELCDGVSFNIYDTPGLNDSKTKNIYFKYVKENIYKIDIAIIVFDVMNALNTSDDIAILDLVLDGIKENANKGITTNLIILLNKCDAMKEENGCMVPDDEEIKEMVEQAKNIIMDKYKTFDINYTSHGREVKEYLNCVWKTLIGDNTDKTAERDATRKVLGKLFDDAINSTEYINTLAKCNNDQYSFKVASKLTTAIFKLANENTKNNSGMTTDELVRSIYAVKKSVNHIGISPAVSGWTLLCISAEDAYTYRMLKRDPKCEMSEKHLKRFGHNEVGKKRWNDLSEKQRHEKIAQILEKRGDYEKRIDVCGFGALQKTISDILTPSRQVDCITTHILNDVRKIKDFKKIDVSSELAALMCCRSTAEKLIEQFGEFKIDIVKCLASIDEHTEKLLFEYTTAHKTYLEKTNFAEKHIATAREIRRVFESLGDTSAFVSIDTKRKEFIDMINTNFVPYYSEVMNYVNGTMANIDDAIEQLSGLVSSSDMSGRIYVMLKNIHNYKFVKEFSDNKTTQNKLATYIVNKCVKYILHEKNQIDILLDATINMFADRLEQINKVFCAYVCDLSSVVIIIKLNMLIDKYRIKTTSMFYSKWKQWQWTIRLDTINKYQSTYQLYSKHGGTLPDVIEDKIFELIKQHYSNDIIDMDGE